jgi:hypothetical protein
MLPIPPTHPFTNCPSIPMGKTKGRRMSANKLVANLAKAKVRSTATTNGRVSGGSAIVRSILTVLRDSEGASMTEAEIRQTLSFAGTASQLRRRIRDAQEVAANAGDMVFTHSAVTITDENGTERNLPRATKAYGIVPAEVAKAAGPEVVKGYREISVDFVFGSDIKETSRQSLQEAARAKK